MGFKLLKYEIKCGVRFYDVQRYEPKIATRLKLIQLFLFGVFFNEKFWFCLHIWQTEDQGNRFYILLTTEVKQTSSLAIINLVKK